jgi:hypothetical protein
MLALAAFHQIIPHAINEHVTVMQIHTNKGEAYKDRLKWGFARLKEVFTRYRFPLHFVSDRGSKWSPKSFDVLLHNTWLLTKQAS